MVMEKQIYIYSYISILILSSYFTSCISSTPLQLNKTDEFYAEKIQIKKPEATVNCVKLKNLTWKFATFQVSVSVTNPYIVPIPLFDLSYNLTSHDNVMAWGSMPDPGSLKAKEVTQLQVPVAVPYNILITLVKDIFRDWDIDYEIDVRLFIRIPIFGKITIPISKKGVINLPTL